MEPRRRPKLARICNPCPNHAVELALQQTAGQQNKKGKALAQVANLRQQGNLMQLCMDGNIENYTPEIFFSFIKKITPQELFTIQIITINDKTDDNFFDSMIVAIPQTQLFKYNKQIRTFSKRIFYKENILSLLTE
jgi:hypothetical protein